MLHEFGYGDYRIQIDASFDTDATNNDRTRANIVIFHAVTGEVCARFVRYVAGLQSVITLDNAIKVGARAAREKIDEGFPPE